MEMTEHHQIILDVIKKRPNGIALADIAVKYVYQVHDLKHWGLVRFEKREKRDSAGPLLETVVFANDITDIVRIKLNNL